MDKDIRDLRKQFTDDIRNLRDELTKFVGSASAQMDNLLKVISEKDRTIDMTYVRKDVMLETLGRIDLTTKQILDQNRVNEKVTNEFSAFVPMLKEMQIERQNVKKNIIEYIVKALIWAVAGGIGVNISK